jgi:hypothetical protein
MLNHIVKGGIEEQRSAYLEKVQSLRKQSIVGIGIFSQHGLFVASA